MKKWDSTQLSDGAAPIQGYCSAFSQAESNMFPVMSHSGVRSGSEPPPDSESIPQYTCLQEAGSKAHEKWISAASDKVTQCGH